MRFPFSLPRLRRPPRADSAPPVPNPSHNNPLDRSTVLSHWRLLGTLNPKSQQYVDLLAELVEVEDNRSLALEFIDDDAGIVINAIDQSLRHSTLQSRLACHSFFMLRKLAGNTGQLPVSYLVKKGADYQVEEQILAGGGFADIRKGKLAEQVVAVKTIRVAQDTNFPKIRKNFCKESVMWMHTSHPNVLELIAVHMDNQDLSYSLISEFMIHGNIMEFIRTNEANRIRLLEDVTKGLRYLHKCGIIHGDLKGTNVLIKNGETPRASLTDFGLSTFAHRESFAVALTLDENQGTWSHMAPELLHPQKFDLREGGVSKQADIYAFGMVVYEVLTGRTPFVGEGRMQEITLQVIKGKRPRRPEEAERIGFGGGTWELTQQCWDENRDKRPVVEDVHTHFQHAAKTSMVMPPGPTTFIHDAGAPTASEMMADSGRRNFTGLFAPASQTAASAIQQVKFVAGVVTGGGNLYSAVSPLNVPLTRTKPSLFNRLGARIKGLKPSLRLAAPASPPAQI